MGGRRSRVAVAISTVSAAGMTVLSACTSSAAELSPAAEHYSRVGTVDGVTFWVRTTGSEAAIRTSGRLGYLCNSEGPSGYSRILLCNDTDPHGGIQAGFVPDGTRSASVDWADLRILPAPGPFDLAVNVLPPDQQLPLGPITVN